ncbi:MAG: multidrug resistance efflux transporter family protein, partial [Chloroflexota bacterium]
MLRLISLGSLAALFFSSTFVINRALSLQGGHWAWTSSLRFGFMLIFLVIILLMIDGKKALSDVKDVFLNH